MKHQFSVFFIVLAAVTILFTTGLFAKVQVGEEIIQRIDTPHPYPGEKGVVFEKVFHYPDAGYIKLHFTNFDLANGDSVEVSSPDGKYSYTYREKGKKVADGREPGKFKQISDFWATFIPGDTAVVRLHGKNRRVGYGFTIDKWARGYERGYIEAVMADLEDGLARTKAICSSDDKEWAKCYSGTTMYDKSKAVCRLLIGGSTACTGWLLGSEGHVMTNEHCITTANQAQNTDYEFMAEGATCGTNCSSWLACPGTVVADSGTLVKNDYDLDYSLILLPTNPTGTYGYLQLRDTLPDLDERIYIPQHPGAYGKQLAVESDTDGPYCKIYNTNASPCHGGPGDIGYYADTAGGSSGSPVIAYEDHLVVALHHCANCPNRGVPIPAIITDLGTDLPNDAVGAPEPPAAPTSLTATAQSCDQIDLGWTDNADSESGFSIERSTDGTNFAEITTVGANVTSYSNTDLSEDTTYWYRVRAYNGAGNSGYTNTANDTTPECPPPQPPAAPTNLSANAVDCDQVDLTWTDNAINETQFKIERSTDGSNFAQIDTVGANVTSYSDTSAAAGTTYWYRVRASNNDGNSAYTNTASDTTTTCPPNAPTNLTATAPDEAIVLHWNDNSDNEDGFKIYRGTTSSNLTLYTTVGANTTSYTDNGAKSGTYYYKVCAYNSSGESCSNIAQGSGQG